MKLAKEFEFPKRLQADFRKAKKIAFLSILYFLSASGIMYATRGSSQVMKAEWIEGMLSLIPPLSFLIASKIYHKRPNKQHPYGFHRVVSIAFLCGSLALFALGIFIFIDSLAKLIAPQPIVIGSIRLFGMNIWLGWLMILALLYSAIPAVFLGHIKIPLAKELHDKILFSDAKMNKADWMTSVGAIFGVVGIGLGFWWADPLAAIIVSIDVTYDGFSNLKTAIFDLMDRAPQTVDREKNDALIGKLSGYFKGLDWVEKAEIRLREEGHVYFGEVALVPKPGVSELTDKIHLAQQAAMAMNWKIYDLSIMPLKEIPEETRNL